MGSFLSGADVSRVLYWYESGIIYLHKNGYRTSFQGYLVRLMRLPNQKSLG
jgi:hypothetical protein